jgi:hypothetical protein
MLMDLGRLRALVAGPVATLEVFVVEFLMNSLLAVILALVAYVVMTVMVLFG